MRSTPHITRLTLILIVCLSAVLAAAPAAVAVVEAQDAPSATITRTAFEFERNGVNFFIDLNVANMQGQDVIVGLWFLDSNDDYLGNAGWGDDYEDSAGNLAVWEHIEPCCAITEYSRANAGTIAFFVPYSEFPSVDYDYTYTPYVSVQAAESGEQLGYAWFDDSLRVLGSEDDPVGYQVWLSIRSLRVNDVQEDGFLEDGIDELMLTYTMTEVTGDGYTGGFDMYAWANNVDQGDIVSDQEFPWLYVDTVATSDVVLWMELVEVDDYSGAQQYIGAVNAMLGTVSLVTTPLKLAPPYAAGITLASWISGVADITVNIIALLDPNDPLGAPQLVLEPNNLRGIAEYDDGWYSSWEFWSDNNYNYEVEYSVFALPYYRHRPVE
jgi:hypothetical protein